jgi:large subunit ribosomal protein L24
MKPLVYKKSRRAPSGPREPERHKLHIAKGDTVRVISGEHRGKEGKVLRVYPKEFRVEVEGVNIVKKHKRAATPNQESGIIEMTAPIAASKVMLLDPKSGEPTRVRRRVDKDGTVERIAVKSGQPIPRVKAK